MGRREAQRNRWSAAAAAVLGAALLGLLMETATPAAVLGAPHRGTVGKRVFVVGDSLAVGTRPFLGGSLRGWRVRTSATISKQAPEGAAELMGRRDSLPPVVVASLGTNGDPRAVASFEDAVRTALRAVGKHGCLVWPNIVRPAVAGASYAGYNRVLNRLATIRDNLRIVDWAAMAAHNRGWFGAGSDGVHPSATGYLARARAIARQVRRCRRSLIE
jgi:lysophospholipase L1-like esterase